MSRIVKIVFAWLLLCLSARAQVAGSCNVIYDLTDFISQPQAVQRLVILPITPLAGVGVNGSNIIVPAPISRPTGTNGSVTVSNVVVGYPLQVKLLNQQSQVLATWTNYFATNLAGTTVNATQGLGTNAGPAFGWIFAPTYTALGAGSNITLNPSNGVLYINGNAGGGGGSVNANPTNFFTNGVAQLTISNVPGSNITGVISGMVDAATLFDFNGLNATNLGRGMVVTADALVNTNGASTIRADDIATASATDNQPAFQAALLNAENGGGTFYVPPGLTYTLTNSLTIPYVGSGPYFSRYLEIWGGQGATIRFNEAVTNGYCIYAYPEGTVYIHDITIENNVNQVSLLFASDTTIIFRNVHFIGCGSSTNQWAAVIGGLGGGGTVHTLSTNAQATAYGTRFIDCTYSALGGSVQINPGANHVIVDNLQAVFPVELSTYGILLNGVSGALITGSLTEDSNLVYGVALINGSQNNTITANYAGDDYTNTIADIFFDATSSNNVYSAGGAGLVYDATGGANTMLGTPNTWNSLGAMPVQANGGFVGNVFNGQLFYWILTNVNYIQNPYLSPNLPFGYTNNANANGSGGTCVFENTNLPAGTGAGTNAVVLSITNYNNASGGNAVYVSPPSIVVTPGQAYQLTFQCMGDGLHSPRYNFLDSSHGGSAILNPYSWDTHAYAMSWVWVTNFVVAPPGCSVLTLSFSPGIYTNSTAWFANLSLTAASSPVPSQNGAATNLSFSGPLTGSANSSVTSSNITVTNAYGAFFGNFGTFQGGANLMGQPGFETDPFTAPPWYTVGNVVNTGGTIVQESTNVHGGSYAIVLTCTNAAQTLANNGPSIYQEPTVTPNSIYQWTFYAMGDGANLATYALYDVTHTTYLIPFTPCGVATFGTWSLITVTFQVPTGCTEIYQFVSCAGVSGAKAWVDDESLVLQAPLVSSSGGSATNLTLYGSTIQTNGNITNFNGSYNGTNTQNGANFVLTTNAHATFTDENGSIVQIRTNASLLLTNTAGGQAGNFVLLTNGNISASGVIAVATNQATAGNGWIVYWNGANYALTNVFTFLASNIWNVATNFANYEVVTNTVSASNFVASAQGTSGFTGNGNGLTNLTGAANNFAGGTTLSNLVYALNNSLGIGVISNSSASAPGNFSFVAVGGGSGGSSAFGSAILTAGGTIVSNATATNSYLPTGTTGTNTASVATTQIQILNSWLLTPTNWIADFISGPIFCPNNSGVLVATQSWLYTPGPGSNESVAVTLVGHLTYAATNAVSSGVTIPQTVVFTNVAGTNGFSALAITSEGASSVHLGFLTGATGWSVWNTNGSSSPSRCTIDGRLRNQ